MSLKVDVGNHALLFWCYYQRTKGQEEKECKGGGKEGETEGKE